MSAESNLCVRARALFPFDVIEADATTVRFMQSFYCEEDEEPGDVAKRLALDIQEALAPAGLMAWDIQSDNDSVWGTIVVSISPREHGGIIA